MRGGLAEVGAYSRIYGMCSLWGCYCGDTTKALFVSLYIQMAECSGRNKWYHRACERIQAELFTNKSSNGFVMTVLQGKKPLQKMN